MSKYDELALKAAESLGYLNNMVVRGRGEDINKDDICLNVKGYICELETENQALRNELEALKGTTMGVDLSKGYINKIKADAVQELIREEMTIGRLHNGQKRSFIFVSDATEHANKLEPPK